MNAQADSSISSMIPCNDEALSIGLSHDSYEAMQLSAAFWETVWPKLLECGWETKAVSNLPGDRSNAIILATRNDLDVASSEEGVDYYTRIKDVIERINLRSNDLEATLADRYRRAISKPNYRTRLSPFRRSTLIPKSTTGTKLLDLSWKDGRKNYPKKSSMIGKDYQVSALPVAGSLVQADRPRTSIYYEQIWDPNIAVAKGILVEPEKDGISNFPYHLREAALLEIARHDYNIEALHSVSASLLKPSNGMDWNQEKKDKFHADIFRFRRNIPAVAKSMNIPLSICQAYYLGTYKNTLEYLLLKTICIDERNWKGDDSQPDYDVCAICGDGGSLIICDGCEGEYHMECLHPPLRVVPAGRWLCDACVDAAALDARDVMFAESQFFESVPTDERTAKKRSLNELTTTGTNDKVSSPIASLSDSSKKHHPSQQFIDAVSTFSLKINEILLSPFD